MYSAHHPVKHSLTRRTVQSYRLDRILLHMAQTQNTLPVFALAREQGWSKEELAVRTGLSSATLDSLRWGRRMPGGKVIRGMRRAFPGKSLEQLFGSVFEAA